MRVGCPGYASRQLGTKDAELGFRPIEPDAVLWRGMPFETLDEPPASAAGKGVERGWPGGC